jgi:hypothetical protein
MGQARKRGSYQERKALAIEENRKIVQLLQEQERTWFENLSEEEKMSVRLKRAKEAKSCASLGNVAAVQHILGGIPFQGEKG